MKEIPTPRRVPAATSEVVISAVQPMIDGGRFAAKAIAGDPFQVTADVFTHGHDLVRAVMGYRAAGTRRFKSTPMVHLGNDSFAGNFVPDRPGLIEVEVLGARDDLATWVRDARRKLEAGRPDPLDRDIGSRLLGAAARELKGQSRDHSRLVAHLAERARASVDLELLGEVEAAHEILAARPIGGDSPVSSVRFTAFADRSRAAFSSWYEMFPRSASPDPLRPGTLRDVIDTLDYVAELGFDVLYLPPIHPIGVTARKGKNNNPLSNPDDVGSPWAIGSELGGHDAIDPGLGNLRDFADLVEEASHRGIEIALDLAFQCSPDHPWVKTHPEWFRHREDGTIACAENPPKRYEDIYPLDFSSTDREGLWRALYEVTRCWVDRGVKLFRVDNPHTKPFAFWEWLISKIKVDDPDVLFLSEAFTRPKVMHRLAKSGFDQSYTYFTWRNEKWELTQYFEELAHGDGPTHFRPNVWPNTPDILPQSLQRGNHAAFIARLVLAGGLAANYGIYGPVFELMWNEPVAPASEEYLNSEKYEIHHHDLHDRRSLREIIARLNFARRAHPALQRNRGLRFLQVNNDNLIGWLKHDDAGSDIVIGVVNLDSHFEQAGILEVDLSEFSVPHGTTFAVHDILSGQDFRWQAGPNFVKLDPAGIPAHLLVIECMS